MSYNAQVTTTADGSSNTISVPFDYLTKGHVHVYENGVEVAQNLLSWLTANSIQLPSTPASGTSLRVQRITPVDPLVTFVAGALSPRDLNKAELQALYLAEEADDTGARGLPLNFLGTEYDAGDYVIERVGTPTTGTDAATKAYVDTILAPIITGTEGVPSRASIFDFGAKGDGITDDSGAFDMANTWSRTRGGGVIIVPPGYTFAVANPINITSPFTVFDGGVGMPSFHNNGTNGYASALKWVGAMGGHVITFQPAPDSNQDLAGCGFIGISIDCDSKADYGLRVMSARGGIWRSITVRSALVCGVEFGSMDDPSSLGIEPGDSQLHLAEQIDVYNQNTDGDCFRFSGSHANGDASLMCVRQCGGTHLNGTAFKFAGCDNMNCYMLRSFRFPGGTGLGLEFTTNPTNDYPANTNLIIHWSSNAGSHAHGTDTVAVAGYGNRVDYVDMGNNTQGILIGTGAGVIWNQSNGITYMSPWAGEGVQKHLTLQKLGLGDSKAGVDTVWVSQDTETLRVSNTANNHIVLTDEAASTLHGINLDSSGDLRINTQAEHYVSISTGLIKAVLPTSSSGLPSGAFWNNGGVVNVVP